MLTKMYVVPLWQEAANSLVKPNVHNFAYSVAYLPSLKNVTTATDSSGFGQTARSTTDYWNVYDWTMS